MTTEHIIQDTGKPAPPSSPAISRSASGPTPAPHQGTAPRCALAWQLAAPANRHEHVLAQVPEGLRDLRRSTGLCPAPATVARQGHRNTWSILESDGRSSLGRRRWDREDRAVDDGVPPRLPAALGRQRAAASAGRL